MGGLQSPILGETLSFDVCKGKFVQVLNVERNHWITVYSTIVQCQQCEDWFHEACEDVPTAVWTH